MHIKRVFSCYAATKTDLTANFSALLLLSSAQLLYVNSVLHLEALQYRGLVELLTGTELLNNTCLFELSLKLLEGLLDVLAFFYWYNNHTVF